MLHRGRYFFLHTHPQMGSALSQEGTFVAEVDQEPLGCLTGMEIAVTSH